MVGQYDSCRYLVDSIRPVVRLTSDPGLQHWKAELKIRACVAGTRDPGVRYRRGFGDGLHVLECSDSPETHRLFFTSGVALITRICFDVEYRYYINVSKTPAAGRRLVRLPPGEDEIQWMPMKLCCC